MFTLRWISALIWMLPLPQPGPDAVYTNAEYHFRLAPPEKWTQKTVPDTLVMFFEPLIGGETEEAPKDHKETNKEFIARMKRINRKHSTSSATYRSCIAIVVIPSPATTLDEYAKDTRERASSLKMYRITQEKPARLGGEPAVERKIRLTLTDGSAAQTREIICLKNGKIFTISIASKPETFSKYSAEYDKMIATFKWQ